MTIKIFTETFFETWALVASVDVACEDATVHRWVLVEIIILVAAGDGEAGDNKYGDHWSWMLNQTWNLKSPHWEFMSSKTQVRVTKVSPVSAWVEDWSIMMMMMMVNFGELWCHDYNDHDGDDLWCQDHIDDMTMIWPFVPTSLTQKFAGNWPTCPSWDM